MALNSIMDPILNPVLGLHPFFALVLMSFIIALAMTLAYKWMTNQTLMKQLKEDIKRYQKEMKENKNNTSKVLEIQKKAMEVNMKYMSHSMKPTLVSFIPIILIFGWMQAHLAYEPIMPGQEFSITADFYQGVTGNTTIKLPEGFQTDSMTKEITNGQANWTLKAPSPKNQEGDNYILEFEKDDESVGKDILITYEQMYKEPTKSFKDSTFKTITVHHKPVKPMGNISIFGWKPGWLGVYIIFSIIFSMSIRKILKLY